MTRIRISLVAFALSFLVLAPAVQATEWQLDPSHTTIQFSIRHMMVSNVRGQFWKFSGNVISSDHDPDKVKIGATIDASSIDTGVAKRDQHLKSADFFDVAQFPSITFKSKKIEPAGESKWKVTGDLTLHGVTKEVVLDVEGPTAVIKDPSGKSRVGATAATTINRKDFGLNWNKALEAGGVIVGESVKVSIEVEAVEKVPGEEAGGL